MKELKLKCASYDNRRRVKRIQRDFLISCKEKLPFVIIHLDVRRQTGIVNRANTMGNKKGRFDERVFIQK